MRITSGFASAADQALLSLLNFGISLAFIRFATKEEYGIYLLLMTPIYLLTGVQNAIVLSPVATVLPGSPENEREAIFKTAQGLLLAFILVSAVASAIGLAIYWYFLHHEVAILLAFAFGLGIAGTCTREGIRGFQYTCDNAIKALSSDGIYALGLITLLALLCVSEKLTAITALLATGVAALWPMILKAKSVQSFRLEADPLQKFWACGRWAIVGVAVAWINLSAYPLVVAYTLDKSAVADINVARLFMVPVALSVTAWSNLYRPKISALAAQHAFVSIRALSIRSIAIGLGSLAGFTFVVALAYPHIEPVLGHAYQGLLPLIVLWSVFFAVGLVRTILMATLMTNADGYKQLQYVGWLALIISLVGLFEFSGRGSVWVVATLIAVETVQLALIATRVLHRWKHGHD